MGSNLKDWREFLFWWAASLFAATTVVVARLGLKPYGAATDFPEDPVAAVLLSLAQGFVGFPLLRDGAAVVFRHKADK